VAVNFAPLHGSNHDWRFGQLNKVLKAAEKGRVMFL
jgi:hypothetical protein